VSESRPGSATNNSSQDTITIADRFRGPPQSGNGGYVAGVAASLLDTNNPVEVTLRSPIPLDTPLTVHRNAAITSIMQSDTLIAEVKESDLDLDVPEPPDWASALQAQPSSPSFLDLSNPIISGGTGFHPICFCCGADHDDGMNVYAAPVSGGEQVAAIWQTKSEWAESDGFLPDAFLWTALDCPGQFAFMAADIITGMLGRMTGEIKQRAKAGMEYLVTGWCIDIEGKKHFAGTAIFDRDDNLLAAAKSVWIGVRPALL
jgi:hypothetical protein